MNRTFEKRYVIELITAKENNVVITLQENNQVLNINNWIGEETVSFM